MTNIKVEYTKLFLSELGKTVNDNTVNEHMPLWWKNTRAKNTGGLRLTELGYEVLKQLDIATYDIPYPKDMPMTAQVIVFLDKFIDCPYFLSSKSITVTHKKKAVELSLFSGDLRKYGLAKAMSRQRNS